jgi:hypothetical protein
MTDPNGGPDGPAPRAAGAGRATLDPRAQARCLLREWREMFRPSSLLPDALAGVAVALVALPLSLAIASASGVSPRVGLVTAAVGGVVVALFGGCRLQVSGPAAALTFLCYEVVERFEAHGREHGLGPGLGLAMLVAATLLAGLLQVLSGVLRLGRLMQFVPRPVVVGFLSGIGITIVCTQLPKVLGYDVRHDEEGGALGLLWQTVRRIDAVRLTSLAVGATAAVLMFALPRLSRRLPAPLVAVATAALLPAALGWDDVARLVHGPCYVGDGCFIGFKSTVHDAVVGEGCVLGIGATVVGVSLPPRRYVGHHEVVDTQEKADALPEVGPDWERLRDDVVAVNRELAAGHRAMLGAARG